MLEAAFWTSLVLGLYPYAGYPLLASLLSVFTRRDVARAPCAPAASVVISAYNEAEHIEATVRNKLAQEYAGTIEVLVASDASDDGTDEILARLASEDSRVRWFRQAHRQGKTAALNRLVELASGEIVVFSDANSLYAPDAVARLVENFADPQVGYVTGKMVYTNPDGTMIGDGCSAYMRYENALRTVETRLGSIVGVDGGIDAVRKECYRAMFPDQLPDFVLPLEVVAQGRRVVFDDRARLEEVALGEGGAEFQMRVRVALRALWAMQYQVRLLFGRAGPLFAWQLISHKLLRYLSFIPLGLAVALGVALAPTSLLYGELLLLQGCFWILALLGSRGVALPGARYAFYFALLNAASCLAFVRYLLREKQVTWRPRLG